MSLLSKFVAHSAFQEEEKHKKDKKKPAKKRRGINFGKRK